MNFESIKQLDPKLQRLNRAAFLAGKQGKRLFLWLEQNKQRIQAAAIATNYAGILWLDLMGVFLRGCGEQDTVSPKRIGGEK